MFRGIGLLFTARLQSLQTDSQAHPKLRPAINIVQHAHHIPILHHPGPLTTRLAALAYVIACAVNTLSRSFFNLCNRNLKACMTLVLVLYFSFCPYVLCLGPYTLAATTPATSYHHPPTLSVCVGRLQFISLQT